MYQDSSLTDVDSSTMVQPIDAFDQGGTLSQKPSGVTCPHCRVEMHMGRISNCQIAGCSKCRGILIQHHVFSTLIVHLRSKYQGVPDAPEPMDAKQLKVRRHCPACLESMETFPYAGAGNSIIDSCTPCRLIWFDAGELDHLVRAPGRR